MTFWKTNDCQRRKCLVSTLVKRLRGKHYIQRNQQTVSSRNEGKSSKILRKACFSSLYTYILILSVSGITEGLSIRSFAEVKEWLI